MVQKMELTKANINDKVGLAVDVVGFPLPYVLEKRLDIKHPISFDENQSSWNFLSAIRKTFSAYSSQFLGAACEYKKWDTKITKMTKQWPWVVHQFQFGMRRHAVQFKPNKRILVLFGKVPGIDLASILKQTRCLWSKFRAFSALTL